MISHSHYLHVAFVSILVFQTFDGMILVRLSFPRARWHVATARVPQMVRDEKKFGNHCHKVTAPKDSMTLLYWRYIVHVILA